MTLSRMSIELLRDNLLAWQKQKGEVALMPILPKRYILLCDTALELMDARELDGTSGQDRESYSDEQDRESYTLEEETDD